MKKNISKKISKATIFLVAFIALTMVFTIYQTSVNNFVVEVATDLEIDESLILGYLPLTAEAASISSFESKQMVDGYSMSNTWGSVVEKSETYTFTATLENDAYKRAAYSAGAITFKSYFTITQSGNHSSRWYVTASGGASSQSTSGSYISSGTSTSGAVNLPGGTTTFTGYLNLRTQGKAFTTQTARAENCGVTLVKGDSTKPSISGSDWQTSNTVTVSDSAAGINTITVEYWDLSGTSKGAQSSLAFTASGTSSGDRITSKEIVFPNQGKYKITATDNVGNQTEKTVWYYDPSVKLTPQTGGVVKIAGANNDGFSSPSSSAITINASSSPSVTKSGSAYYLYAGANEGYYFTGFTLGGGSTAMGSYYKEVGGRHVWRKDESIPDPPKQSTFNWTASFASISGVLQYMNESGKHTNFGDETEFTFAYTGASQTYFKATSGTARFTYSGTMASGNAYASSETAPTYAGNYTVLVEMLSGGNVTGYATYTFEITKLNITATPLILDKTYDGNAVAVQGKSGNSDDTAWEYTSKTDAAVQTIAGKDGIGFKTNAGVTFAFPNERAGTSAKNITMTPKDDAATLTSTKSNSADVIASYVLTTTDDGVQANINPKELKVSLGEYTINTDGTASGPLYDGSQTVYVNGTKVSGDTTYYGRVYNKTNVHYVTGLVFDGLIAGDTIIVTKPSGIGTSIAAYDSGAGSGNACKSLTSLKTITTEELTLTGGKQNNYALNYGQSDFDSTTPYSGASFTMDMKNILISQAPIEIKINSNANTNKVYDGTKALSTGAVTVSLDINSAGFATVKDNTDEVTIETVTGVSVSFDDASANYNDATGSFFGAKKTITATGYTLKNANEKSVTDNYHLVNSTVTLVSADYSSTTKDDYSCFLIKTRAINLSVTVTDKVYDGTNVMYNNGGDPILNSSGIVSADSSNVTLTMVRPTYDRVNVGDSTVSTTVTLSGTASANYHLAGDSDDALVKDTDGKQITINGIIASITPKSFSDTDISASLSGDSFNYDLSSHKPTPTITDSDVAGANTTLTDGTDYDFAYYVKGTSTAPISGDIKNAGSYDVIITAKGNYTGTITKTYVINKAKVEVEIKGNISIIYGDSYYTTSDGGASYYHESFDAGLIVTTNVNNTADVISGTWTYDQILDDYPTVGTHTLKVKFKIDGADGYADNYDYTEGVSNKTVDLVVSKRPITLVIKNQNMIFGEDPTAKFVSSSKDSAFALKDGSLGLVQGTTLADFGTVVCDVTSKTYPSKVEDINATNAGDLLMAGTYAITPKGDQSGTLLENYDYGWENGTFTVSQRAIELSIASNEKIYGEADPSFAYLPGNQNNLLNVSNTLVDNKLQLYLVGALSRAEGENVGSYAYNANTLRPDAKDSYTVEDYVEYYNVINYKFETFTISGTPQQPIQFSIKARSIYLDLSSYQGTSIFGDEITIDDYNFSVEEGLVNGDDINASFPEFKIIRTATQGGNDATGTITVGSYNLTLYYKSGSDYEVVPTNALSPTTALNANYSVYATRGSWTITTRPIVITPNNSVITKTYSEKDPASITSSASYTASYKDDSSKTAVISGYNLSGSLGREEGENVGFYPFTQGTLTNSNNANYSITFDNTANYGLTINPLNVTLKPDDTRSGYANVYNAVVYNDDETKLLASIEDKVPYIRTQFSVTVNKVNNQYDIDSINSLGLVVSAEKIENKITLAGGGFILPKTYDHDGDGNLGYPTNVGMYNLVLNNVTDGDEFSNYVFTVEQIETFGSFEIQPLSALIIPDAKSIIYGDDIPELTYKAVDPIDKTTEVDLSNFTGSLKVQGETNSDGYLIAGDMHRIVNDNITSENYRVSFETATFTVLPKPVTVSINGVDSTNTIKVIYGNADPIIPLLDENTEGDAFFPYTFSINGLLPSKSTGEIDYSPFAYSLTQRVSLARDKSDTNIGTYKITEGTVKGRNDNYEYKLDKDYFIEIIARPITVTPIAGLSSYYGNSMNYNVQNASAYTTSYNASEYVDNGELYAVLNSDTLENVSTTISLSKDGGDYWMVRVAGMQGAVQFQDADGNPTQSLSGTLYVYENGLKLFTFSFTEQNGNLQFTVTANRDNVNTSDYDGSYSYYLNRRDVMPGDTFEGQLSVDFIIGGEYYSDTNAPVGEYSYILGTLSSSNYTIVLDANSPKYNVEKRPLIVKLNSTVNITFGEIADNVPYTVYEESGYESTTTTAPQIFFTIPTGILTPGAYPIKLDTSRVVANNPNFNILFNDEDYVEYLVVNKKTITLTPDSNQAKGYMEELGTLTFHIDGDFVTGYVPSDEAFKLTLNSVEDTTNAAPGTYDYLFIVTSENFTNGDETVALEDCYNVVSNYKDALSNTIKFSISPKQASFKITYTTLEGDVEAEKVLVISKDEPMSVKQIVLLDYTASAQTVKIEMVDGATYHDGTVAGRISTYYDGTFDNATNLDGTELYCKDAGTYFFEISTEAQDINFLSYFTKASITLEVVVGKRSLDEIDPTTELTVQKTYGEEDPSFSFTITSPYGEELIGTLKRDSGENVGSYALVRDTVKNADGTENSNYVITIKATSFIINAKAISWTPTNLINASKTYGDDDGEIYEDVQTEVNDEVVRVIYEREDGEDAGKYGISIRLIACLSIDEFGRYTPVKDEFGAYVVNGNYTITLAEGSGNEKYEIKQRKATVIANGLAKVFDGEAIDLSTLSYNAYGVLEGETLVGSVTISAGAPIEAGTYAIELVGFDVTENSNYAIELTNAKCVITPAPISIKADSVTYEYGDTPTAFTYVVTGTVYEDYPLEGELESLGERPSMGEHAIQSGTLNNDNGRNPNYLITYIKGGVCTVTARSITIKVTSSVSQVYGDEPTAIPFEVVSENGLIEGDTLRGNLAPIGSDVNLEGHDITIGDVQTLNTNYVITLITDGAKYVITPRPITVTADAKTVVYGDAPVELTYTVDGLVSGDTLSGALECTPGTDCGNYAITQGTLANSNYEIVTFNGASYTVTQRAIVITINDAESNYGDDDAPLTYYLSKGNLLEGDDLGIILAREEGSAMGTYVINGTHSNANYTVEFITGIYTIHKYKAVITVETEYLTFIEDGDARSITAVCSSGAEIIFKVKGEEVSNAFRDAGKYTVELTALETDEYYAPDAVYVYITINRPVLKAESSGIDVTLTTENGFNPSLSVEMDKLPTDYMDMIAELTSKQKIVRAFTLTSIDESGVIDEVTGKTTVTIKVPTMLSEENVVQVLVREDGVYNVVDVEVIDGYVTLEVDSLSSFAFITEEDNNYLMLILIGVAALIMLGSVMVFLFRKRT